MNYPIERGPLIEVGRPRNGRPGYAWVQGWVVRYSATCTSIPLRYNDARNLAKEPRPS